MSFREVVEEVAARLEKESETCEDAMGLFNLAKSAARDLRTAIKASEGNGLPPAPFPKAKEDKLQREIKERVHQEEVSGEQMVELVGGPLAGDMIAIPSDMPPLAKTSLVGVVYQLSEDRKQLCFLPPKAVS